MQPDRFTIKSQEALQAAQRLAEDRRNPQTQPEHLLAVLQDEPGARIDVLVRFAPDALELAAPPRRRCATSRTSTSRPST